MYYDEIEICNPLGGQNGIHKLGRIKYLLCEVIVSIIIGMFYYTIGNLRPELRSSHRAIQLLACVYSTHVNSYGLESILKPIIEDINKLAKV